MAAQVINISRSRAVGAEIRRCREFNGMKQLELAEAIGKSDAYISRIEKGHREATKGDLIAFAQLLGVPQEWLENPPMPPTVELGPWLNSEDQAAHNVHPLDAHGQVIEGPWGDGPDGGTPVQMRLPRAA